MFDVIINFWGYFKGCFRSNEESKNIELELLKDTIALEKDNDVIISIILMKLVMAHLKLGCCINTHLVLN